MHSLKESSFNEEIHALMCNVMQCVFAQSRNWILQLSIEARVVEVLMA